MPKDVYVSRNIFNKCLDFNQILTGELGEGAVIENSEVKETMKTETDAHDNEIIGYRFRNNYINSRK